MVALLVVIVYGCIVCDFCGYELFCFDWLECLVGILFVIVFSLAGGYSIEFGDIVVSICCFIAWAIIV